MTDTSEQQTPTTESTEAFEAPESIAPTGTTKATGITEPTGASELVQEASSTSVQRPAQTFEPEHQTDSRQASLDDPEYESDQESAVEPATDAVQETAPAEEGGAQASASNALDVSAGLDDSAEATEDSDDSVDSADANSAEATDDSADSFDSAAADSAEADDQCEADESANAADEGPEATLAADDGDEGTNAPASAGATRRGARVRLLEREGEIAADFLERLLDIADLDGDIEVDIDGDRAAVSIVDSEDGRVPRRLVGQDAKVLDAIQELTRLAVQKETGERSRLMLDVAGYRAERRRALVELARVAITDVKTSGSRRALENMTAFERKIIHDEVAAAGLDSESEGVEPNRHIVIMPA